MWERYQLFSGLLLEGKKISSFCNPNQNRVTLWRIFSSNKSVPANRKDRILCKPWSEQAGWIHFCMKRLRTLKSFQIFKSKNKKLRTYSGWCPSKGLSNDTTLMQIQSGRTVPLNASKKYRLSQRGKKILKQYLTECATIVISWVSQSYHFKNCLLGPYLPHKKCRRMSHSYFPTIRHVHLINPQDYARSIDHRSNFYRPDVRPLSKRGETCKRNCNIGQSSTNIKKIFDDENFFVAVTPTSCQMIS